MKPRYKHDCQECIFLGEDEEVDVYFCYHTNGIPVIVLQESPELLADYITPHPSWATLETLERGFPYKDDMRYWYIHYYNGVSMAAKRSLIPKTEADEILVGK